MESEGGWLAFAAFAIGNALLVPAAALTLAAGYTRGFGETLVIATAGRVVGGLLAFKLSRLFVRQRLSAWLARRPGAEAWDRALRTGGMRAVVLLRLSPLVPSAVCNYSLGASRVRTRDFVAGTAVGTLPSTLLYAWLGAGLAGLGSRNAPAERSPWEHLLFFGGLMATVAVVLRLKALARRELERIRPTNEESPESPSDPRLQYTRQDSNLEPPGS
ncbi:MAG: TVP38/TMEM64 family protein [Planctomycetes bacterium]|nr:TVP38/TMEM64 family protein [Planctomycetota bacterium]